MNAVPSALAPYQGAAVVLVSYLATALWMGAAIAALAALVVRFWKPLDAAARYAVWYVALLAVVLGPLATTVALQARHAPPTPQQIAEKLKAARDGTTPVRFAVREQRPAVALPPAVAYGAAAVWLLVVLGGAARFVAGAVGLARLKRDALPLAPERRAALPLWQSHADAAGARRARLCVSDKVEVPVAVGLFDGMVVIPQQVMDAFEPIDVDRFVLHELAHLERRDDWTTVVQRIVQIVMFFNPAVHVIARQLDLEREIACDDRVVAETSDVRSYAVGLTRMAESTAWPHRGIAAPAIFVTRRQLSLRVEQLLTGRRFAARRVAFAPAVAALVASLGVVAIAMPLPPAVGVGRDGAALSGLTRVQVTKLLLTGRNRHTATLKSGEAGVMVFRADSTNFDEITTLKPLDQKEVDAILKRLGDRGLRHSPDVERLLNEALRAHHTAQSEPAPQQPMQQQSARQQPAQQSPSQQTHR
jgi:beta-lactamase regulating signal transducer with metallopeptidase domain